MATDIYKMGTVNLGGTSTPSSNATPTVVPANTKSNVPTAEQNLAAYNASQTKTPAMNASNISPTTPIPIASPYVDPNSYSSKINNVATDLNSTLASSQANVDALNKQGQSQALDISNLQSLLGGKSADTMKTYNEQGVTTAYNQLVDLNAQATGLKNEASAIPIQIQNEFKGTGATEAGAGAIQTSRLRDNALKALSLGQQAAIASAQYDKAKNYADMVVDAKYSQMEADIKAKQTNLAALNDYQLTPAQSKLKDDKTAALNVQAQQLADKKELEKNINSVLLEAQKNNASPDTMKAIQNSQSMGDAIKNAGTSLSSPETEVVKIGDSTAYLIDKRTGKVIRSFGGGTGSGGSGGSAGNTPITLANGQTVTRSGIADTIIASGKFTKDQAASIRNAINNGEDPTTVIKNNAKNILTATESADLNAAERSLDSMNRLEASLKNFYANGGKSSLLKGKYETVVNKLGDVKDPALAAFAVQVQLDLQQYRKDISGTAFGIQEAADIASVFPSIEKGEILNNIVVKERKNKLQATVDSTYRSVLGQKGVDTIKAIDKPFAIGNMTPSEFVEKSLVRKGINYTNLINATPQGQIPIVDKNTGEAYYIPYKEFNAETDIKI